jgi:hypothetical protein
MILTMRVEPNTQEPVGWAKRTVLPNILELMMRWASHEAFSPTYGLIFESVNFPAILLPFIRH